MEGVKNTNGSLRGGVAWWKGEGVDLKLIISLDLFFFLFFPP